MSYNGALPPGQGYAGQQMYGQQQQQHQQQHQQHPGFHYQQTPNQHPEMQHRQQPPPQHQAQYQYQPQQRPQQHQQQHGYLAPSPQLHQQPNMYGQGQTGYAMNMNQQWAQQQQVQGTHPTQPQYNGNMGNSLSTASPSQMRHQHQTQQHQQPSPSIESWSQHPQHQHQQPQLQHQQYQQHNQQQDSPYMQGLPQQSTGQQARVEDEMRHRAEKQQQMRRQSLQQQATQYSQQQQTQNHYQQLHQQSPQPSPQPQFQPQFQQQARPSPQPNQQAFYSNASPSPQLQHSQHPSPMIRHPSIPNQSFNQQQMPQSPHQRLPSHSQSPQIQNMPPRQPSQPPQLPQQRKTSQPPTHVPPQRQSSIPIPQPPPMQPQSIQHSEAIVAAPQTPQQPIAQRHEPTPQLPDPEPMHETSQDEADDTLIENQLQNEQMHFVNLQDIQMPSTIAPTAMDGFMSIDPRDLSLSGSVAPSLLEPISIKTEIKQEQPDMPMNDSVPIAPPPKPSATKIKSSPHASLNNSPLITARSPSITKRSPSVSSKPRPVQTVPLMIAIAEECLEKARAVSHDVAMSLADDAVEEYQQLIATTLTCFETALDSSKLTPREEARLRLRYATVLQEETENLMEAETALTKGVTLCDKHRLFDLKYCLQYSMLKTLFQRNQKAALKAVDGYIANCEAFKHVHWYYAFRLLKATFYHEMGHSSDLSALENLRAIQNIANVRGDVAIGVLASLLEGLALLKTEKDGNLEKVHGCLAQAAKYQLDPSVQIMELDVLTMVLDFASSLQHHSPDVTTQKLRRLQKALDDAEDWNNVRSDFEVPIKKQSTGARTVSEDTSGIIRAGNADGPSDFLVMSFMTKMELRSLVFTFSGLASFHKPSSQGRRAAELWSEGLKILETWDKSTAGIPYGPPVPLHTAISQREWRTEGQVYLRVMLGLLAASHCQWAKVKVQLKKLKSLISASTQPTLRLLAVYLGGVYQQGTGDVKAALDTFLDEQFTIPQSTTAGAKVGQREVALLAGLNRLWLMQHPSCRNDYETQELLEQLQPICNNHWNIDLRTAWHNVAAALVTEPPQQLNQQKQHMHVAMGGSKNTSNILGAAVTLCIMRSRFFENVIGDQALKSALAASKQAQRSGNMLWQSVADGMLAHSYEMAGEREQSINEMEKATQETRQAFSTD